MMAWHVENLIKKTHLHAIKMSAVVSISGFLAEKGLRGELKKSGLAFGLITLVIEQLPKNSKVLQNPHKISNILVYSSFSWVEN